MGKNGIHMRDPRRKHWLIRTISLSHICQKKHPDDSQVFWENILWTDRTKDGLFVCCCIWCKTNTAVHIMNIIATVKYSGASVIVWHCFAASGPEWLAIIDETMKSAFCEKILKVNAQPSVCALKLKHTRIMQRNNDLKQVRKSTSEWLQKEQKTKTKWNFWSSQNKI